MHIDREMGPGMVRVVNPRILPKQQDRHSRAVIEPILLEFKEDNMKQKRGLMIGLAALLVAALIFLGVYLATRPSAEVGAKTVTVEVVHGDGTQKEFVYHTDMEYLGELLLSEELVQGDAGEYGLYITVVDGEEAIYETDGAYWALYENGDYAMQGADETPLSDGDNFSLVYTAE